MRTFLNPYRRGFADKQVRGMVAAGSAVVFAACSAIAWAADDRDGRHGPQFPIDISAAEAKLADHFARLDASGDGSVSREEFAAQEHKGRQFGRHGKRHGGWRHLRDGAGAGNGQQWRDMSDAQRQEKRAEMERDMFSKLDSDQDGVLSEDEFTREKQRNARRALMQDRIFAHLDSDASGGITADEMPNPIERLRAADADGNGLVTRREMRSARHGHRMHGADAGQTDG